MSHVTCHYADICANYQASTGLAQVPGPRSPNADCGVTDISDVPPIDRIHLRLILIGSVCHCILRSIIGITSLQSKESSYSGYCADDAQYCIVL